MNTEEIDFKFNSVIFSTHETAIMVAGELVTLDGVTAYNLRRTVVYVIHHKGYTSIENIKLKNVQLGNGYAIIYGTFQQKQQYNRLFVFDFSIIIYTTFCNVPGKFKETGWDVEHTFQLDTSYRGRVYGPNMFIDPLVYNGK
ncbi:hypothetical protein [Microcystis phage Mel-JY01]